MEYIPKGISIPLWEVSCKLDVPPVLMNMDITLFNWRRLDPNAGINMMNIATLHNFFGGRDESWFYLITVEIEAVGAAAIIPLLQINEDIKRVLSSLATQTRLGHQHVVRNVVLLEAITSRLQVVASAIEKMVVSLSTTREGCHPFIFYHRVRPFLAGWKNNPAVPNGVKYEGIYVSWEDRDTTNRNDSASQNPSAAQIGSLGWSPKKWFRSSDATSGDGTLESCPAQYLSGGSAAQSALLPFLDISLGVDHTNHDKSSHSNGFLRSMRDYMPRQHREFLQVMEEESCIGKFMVTCQKELVREHLTRNLPLSSSATFQSLLDEVKREEEAAILQQQAEAASYEQDQPGESWSWRGQGVASVTAEDVLDEKAFAALSSLCEAYDNCLRKLTKFRSGHIGLVADYILAQQRAGKSESLEGNAGGKGTGGTDLINFLKPIRDNCSAGVLKASGGEVAASTEERGD
jgi:indoleamine 2,3-dioxygenase